MQVHGPSFVAELGHTGYSSAFLLCKTLQRTFASSVSLFWKTLSDQNPIGLLETIGPSGLQLTFQLET